MSLLTTYEIRNLCRSNDLIIGDIDLERWIDEDVSRDNPFQQCSIDLGIGAIFVPETSPENLGGARNPVIDDYILEPGHTALIRTNGEITLPSDVGGFCFSPSRLALKAVLVTNMGHVDPGYSGYLHFTAINMGKTPYILKANDAICTMTLFSLSEPVPPYGRDEIDEVSGLPMVMAKALPRLAKDFVEVENRATNVAKKLVEKAKLWAIVVPITAAVITIAGNYFLAKPWEKDFKGLESRLNNLEAVENFEKRILELEDKIK